MKITDRVKYKYNNEKDVQTQFKYLFFKVSFAV